MSKFKGDIVLASKTIKVKSWNYITMIIQKIVKIKVYTTYLNVSQYMIL